MEYKSNNEYEITINGQVVVATLEDLKTVVRNVEEYEQPKTPTSSLFGK